jgi:ubiquinone/menaquinone biosynthesis C-methylase UbiE
MASRIHRLSEDRADETLKQRVRDFWQANPCGAKFAGLEIGTAEFFTAVEQHRYETEWHIPEVIGFERWAGKDVLEVGCGLGTEAVRFARCGARYTGVDLTERSIDLVGRRFQLEGLTGELKVADAEALPFPDASFDLVYSHGVLHHTPGTQKAIGQIRRVLRAGGTAMVMLYHKHSYNYLVNIMLIRRLGARLLRLKSGPGLIHKITGEDPERLAELQRLYRADRRALLSHDEFLSRNTDGAGNPLAKVYSKGDVERLFSNFSDVRIETHFLNKRWIPIVGKLLTRSVEGRLASRFGWHLWTIARR